MSFIDANALAQAMLRSSPRIGSLFSGYGGLDMGVMAALGGSVAWHVEFDKAPSKILAHHWPDVPNYGDVTAVDWSAVEPVDIITGGSPCQDLSHAGKRAGMTEGTRSNLWVAMREAIAQLRPDLVVWENVRGAYSAAADSEVEPCAGCVGDRPGVHLRALGRVLGDLSDLGYDCRWHGLRAADVGAPHGRFRVFVVANARDAAGHGEWARAESRQGGSAAAIAADLGHERAGSAWDGRPGPADGDRGSLLGTPRASEWKGSGPVGSKSFKHMLEREYLSAQVLSLLPTPAVNDMGEGKTPEAWDEWTAKMQAAHGNGNGHGKSLAIEAQRMATTERSGHVGAAEGRPSEVLRDVRDGDHATEVCEWPAGGPERIPAEAALLADVREQPQGDPARQSQMAGEADCQAADVRGVRRCGQAARSPHRPEPREQLAGESGDALPVVPPSAALAGGPGDATSVDQDWGVYTDAIRRWEHILGRKAPAPTQLSTRGRPQLDPRFSEFLMGLPEGHVTGVPGLSRNDMLKALGNGVVWQQAAAAIRFLLSVQAVAA